MLGRGFRNVALIAALALTVPAAAQAQAFIYGGGGVLVGVGDTGDATDAGWMALAGFGVPLGDGDVAIGAEGIYGNLGGANDGPSADIYGAFGTIGIAFGEPGNVRPYIYGGAGILGSDSGVDSPGVDSSDTEFGYEGVAGLDFPVGDRVGIFVEGRYLGASDFDAINGSAGVSIGLGG